MANHDDYPDRTTIIDPADDPRERAEPGSPCPMAERDLATMRSHAEQRGPDHPVYPHLIRGIGQAVRQKVEG